MLTNTERQQIVEEVNAGTYGIDEALDDIAAAQKGEEVRKALYAEVLVLNREGHAGSNDMIARQQIANLQTSVNGQISTLRTEVGEDIDDLEDALNSGLATQNGRIAAQNATIANVVANYNVEYGSTELWASTGETGALAAGTTVTLSEDVSHFDYIDIYSFCGNSNVLDTVPVDAKLQSSQGYALRWVNLSDPDSGSYKAYVRIIETRLHIIGTTLTIDHQVTYRNGEEVNISGAEITQSNRSTYVGELGIMKIVGRKITANTEIEDVRIGADGTKYASAGQAVRAQVQALEDSIPAVDSTLSTQGAAADAKVAGDKVAELKSELNAFEPSVFYDTTIKRGINLFNKNDARNKDGYYRDQNGALVQATGTGLFLSHPIAVKAGVEYSAIRRNGSYEQNNKGFVVDASGDIVYGIFDCQTKTNASGDTFITFTPEKNCLVQLNLGKDSGTYAGYLKENCMVCKTSDMPSGDVYLSYEPYMTEALTNVDSNRKEPASNIEIVKAGNLFNKDDADIISNKYISFTLMDVDGYYVSHPILVKKGVKYAVTHGDALGNARMLIYLDHDMNMLPNGSFCTQDSTYPDADVFTARMTGYVRVNLGKHPEKIVMCEADNYNGFYCDFGFTLPKLKYPQLYGKIVSFNGDSICAGQGYSGGYGKIIAERNGMIYENIGVNGGTITAETYYQNGKPRHWICRTIENMRADADYVILEGGVNDSVTSIGTVPDVNDYTSTLDDTNYAQAFESMLKKAIDRFKGKKIGYIAIHKCTVTFTSNGNEERNRYTIAINACKKWGIPVCDLNINCLPLGYIDGLKADYTYQGDGWHPNEAGYKAYYVPKIEAWMASL